MLGSYSGSRHTTPDLTLDIAKIIQSLQDHGVYRLRPGRTFDDEDEPVPDAESVGLHSLLDGKSSALAEYNKSFRVSQEARRRPIVSEMVSNDSLPRYPPDSNETQASTSEHQVDEPQETEAINPVGGTSQTTGDQESEVSEEQEELGGVDDESDDDFESQDAVADIELEDEELAAMFFGSAVDDGK